MDLLFGLNLALAAWSAGAGAAPEPEKAAIEVPFAKKGQTVVLTITKSRCTAGGEKAYFVDIGSDGTSAKLVCKLRPPVDQFDGETPINIVENFKYPRTILADIEADQFPELKKQGKKAITVKKRS